MTGGVGQGPHAHPVKVKTSLWPAGLVRFPMLTRCTAGGVGQVLVDLLSYRRRIEMLERSSSQVEKEQRVYGDARDGTRRR